MKFNLPGRRVKPNTAERELMDAIEKRGRPANDEAWIIDLLMKQARQIDKLNEKLSVYIARRAPR